MTHFLFKEKDGLIAYSEAAHIAARDFALSGWNARRFNLGQPPAKDLSNACKFASLFARELFGGIIKGNAEHQFLELSTGQVVDLTEGSAMFTAMCEPMSHDPEFWGNPNHIDSLESCVPRVKEWVEGFMSNFQVRPEAIDDPTLNVDMDVFLGEVFDPFTGDQWDIPAFDESDVQAFIDRRQLSSRSWQAVNNGKAKTEPALIEYHMSRIAYLTVFPDDTPIRIEEFDEDYLRIDDGYHRVAAAVMRGVPEIKVSFPEKDRDLVCEIFGLDDLECSPT